MTCTYGFSHFRHFQNCCNRDGNTIFKYINYVPIVVATDLEVHFSVLKNGVSQYFCLYSVCTSHWCLVMSFWLNVKWLNIWCTRCIYKTALKLSIFCIAIVYFPLLHQGSILSFFMSYWQRNCFCFYFRVDWRRWGQWRIVWIWGKKSLQNWRKTFELLSKQKYNFKANKNQEIFHLHSVWKEFDMQI